MSNPLSLLPHMPIAPAWLEQHPAAYAEEPRLFRAAFRLLCAAWRGVPAGTLPDGDAFLRECTGLPMELVVEHRDVLWYGFAGGDSGRKVHIGMKALADGLLTHYGKEIEGFVRSAAMVAQSPDEFALASVDVRAGRKPRGKTALPPAFGFEACPELRSWCQVAGYATPESQDWVMDKFRDYCRSRDERYKDFEAAFRTFAKNELMFSRGRIPGLRTGVDQGLHPAQSAAVQRGPLRGSRGDQAAQVTADLFAHVSAQRGVSRDREVCR